MLPGTRGEEGRERHPEAPTPIDLLRSHYIFGRFIK